MNASARATVVVTLFVLCAVWYSRDALIAQSAPGIHDSEDAQPSTGGGYTLSASITQSEGQVFTGNGVTLTGALLPQVAEQPDPDKDGGIHDSVTEDLNGDGVTDANDLVELLASWGGQNHEKAASDLDRDGIVGPEDLFELIDAWKPRSQ